MSGWNEQTWVAFWIGAALKSTILMSAAWLLAFGLRRQSAALRHLVWTAAAAALLALPLLSVSMPVLPVRAGALAPLVSTVTFRTSAVASADAAASAHPLAGPERLPAKSSRPADFRFPLALCWAAGTALMALQMIAAWVVMWRMRRGARPLPDSRMFQMLAEALGIRRPVALLEAPRGGMPLSFGVLRPAVFLPADAREWSDDRRRVVMLHELAHIRRGDLATQMVVRPAVALFWWNPLAWMAWREFVKERERAADDLVLAFGEPATAYAGHLLEIARSMQRVSALVSAAVAMARPSQLEGRLMAILDARTDRRSPGPRAALVSAVLAIALVAPFAALEAQDKPDPVLQPAVDATIKAAVETKNHDITDNAAAAYVKSHQYDAAQQLLANSLSIRAETSGDRSSAYAIGLEKLGDLSARRGKVTDAVDFYTRAAALGDTPETAPGLVYLAMNALAAKDLLGAQSFVDRALAAAPDGAVAGRALTIKGNIAMANGLSGVAETSYLQALAQDPPDSTDAAFTMETYARFLSGTARDAEAEAIRAQALPIRQKRVAEISGERVSAEAGTRTAISSGTVRVGNGVSAPILTHKTEPEFSEEARVAKYQGTVVLSVVISPDGHATNLQLIKSLGFGLDEKAAEAVSQWEFVPGRKNGAAVSVQASIEVNFRLL